MSLTTITVEEGPSLATRIALAGLTIDLDPDSVANLQRELDDKAPQVCTRCSGSRFADKGRIHECPACSGEGWVR